jgi:hypothetical protein
VSTALEFHTSIAKTLGVLCLNGAIIALGYYIVTHTTGYQIAVGWLCVAFFGLMFVLGCIRLVQRAPAIVMSPEGLSGSYVGRVPVKWSDIAAISIVSIQGQRFLRVWMRDRDAYIAGLPLIRRFLARLQMSYGSAELSLNFGVLRPGLREALEYAVKHVPTKPDA